MHGPIVGSTQKISPTTRLADRAWPSLPLLLAAIACVPPTFAMMANRLAI